MKRPSAEEFVAANRRAHGGVGTCRLCTPKAKKVIDELLAAMEKQRVRVAFRPMAEFLRTRGVAVYFQTVKKHLEEHEPRWKALEALQ